VINIFRATLNMPLKINAHLTKWISFTRKAHWVVINPQQPLRLNEGCRADWAALDISRYCPRLRLASRATALWRGHDRYLEVP
jgi:hypothetical protein